MSPSAREVLAKGRSSSPGAARRSAIALLQQLRRRVQPERAVPPLTKVPRVMATRGPVLKAIVTQGKKVVGVVHLRRPQRLPRRVLSTGWVVAVSEEPGRSVP